MVHTRNILWAALPALVGCNANGGGDGSSLDAATEDTGTATPPDVSRDVPEPDGRRHRPPARMETGSTAPGQRGRG